MRRKYKPLERLLEQKKHLPPNLASLINPELDLSLPNMSAYLYCICCLIELDLRDRQKQHGLKVTIKRLESTLGEADYQVRSNLSQQLYRAKLASNTIADHLSDRQLVYLRYKQLMENLIYESRN